MTLRQPSPSVAKPSKEIRAIANPSIDDQEETDDLYALLGNITSPPSGLDTTSHASPAASPTNTRGEENLQQPLGTAEPADCAPETVEDVFMPSRSTDLGQGFVGWMKAGIAARRLFINDTKALIHTVDGTAMLVTPGIFKRYVHEHPELEKLAQAKETTGWKLVQRAFEKQGLHRKTNKNLNIWTIKVSGPRKTKELKAYLLQDPKLLFLCSLWTASLTVITDAEGVWNDPTSIDRGISLRTRPQRGQPEDLSSSNQSAHEALRQHSHRAGNHSSECIGMETKGIGAGAIQTQLEHLLEPPAHRLGICH